MRDSYTILAQCYDRLTTDVEYGSFGNGSGPSAVWRSWAAAPGA